MKTVIITGVSGQDGSYMVNYLLEVTDFRIIGVVRRLSVPNHENIAYIKNDRFQIRYADVADKTSITNLIEKEKPDYFINFAANSFVGNSWDMPYNHIENNFVAVLHQLEAIKNFAPMCRYYNAGSSEEFGNVDYSPQNEKHPLKPRSPYGVSKVAARQMVKVYRESYGLYAIQGQLFNHESPRRGVEFVSRKIAIGVANIYNAIEKGKEFSPIELGNLDAKRDWSHAIDFVVGIWLMLNQEKHNEVLSEAYHSRGRITTPGEIPEDIKWLSKNIKEYILASGETYPVRNFVELAFYYANIKGSWTTPPFSSDQGDEIFVSDKREALVKINPKFYRPAEVELLCGDSSAARRDLGWKPKYSFERLVEEMVMSELWKIQNQ